MQFNTIYSLGSRCQNSDILKYYGYREFSGFFDFMNTRTVDNLNHILYDNFNEILKDNNNFSLICDQLTIDPETRIKLLTSIRTSNRFYDKDHTDVSGAIFPHHDLNTYVDKNHFIKCKERFSKLINYNVLFNYTFNKWENDITTEDIEKMLSSLKNIHNFENFKICFIGLNFGISGYENVHIDKDYDIWSLTIPKSSFTGGLYVNEIDNKNYINIIKAYNISEVRVSKEEIDDIET